MGEQPEHQSPTAASRATAATTPLLSPPPDEPNACLSSPLPAGSFSSPPRATRMSCWLSRHGFSAAGLPFFPNTPPGAFQQQPHCPLAPRLKVRTSLQPPGPAVPAHTHPSAALSQGKGKQGTARCQGGRAETFSRTYSPGLRAAACPQQAQPVPQEPQFTPQFVPTLPTEVSCPRPSSAGVRYSTGSRVVAQ